MPRNASGTYSLPAGNPVVSGAVIESTWANNTLTDLGDAITGSLARDGSGGMVGAFKLVDGTSSLPGLAFTNESSSGIYRPNAGEWWATVLTNPIFQVNTSGLNIATSKVLSLQAGTVGAPALTFTSDNNTGIWSPAADTVAVAAGGSEKLRIGAAGVDVTGTLGVSGATTLTGALTINGGIANNPTFTAGTANGVTYLNASKALTSGSALTFDGTYLGVGTNDPQAQIHAERNWASETAVFVNNSNASGGYTSLRLGNSDRATNGDHLVYGAASLGLRSKNGAAITFEPGGSEAMRLTSTGLGIGTSSPVSRIHASGGNYPQLTIDDAATRTYGIGVTSAALTFYDRSAGAERARIDQSGNLLVNTTTQFRTGATGTIQMAQGGFVQRNTNASAGLYRYMDVDANNTLIVYNQSNVGVYLTSSGTSWTANSDERIKDIIEPITNAAEKVATLRAVIGKYKTDDEGTRRAFLIAQDVQAVLPEAVHVQSDEIGTMGVQYTDTIPLLVAAIKELKAELDATKARLTALEAPSK